MTGQRYILNVKPVTAVQWFHHGDHPTVKRLGAVHDPRLEGDDRQIGVCQTHYGEKFILAGDWIVTDQRGFVLDVLKDWQFRRDYVACAPIAGVACIRCEGEGKRFHNGAETVAECARCCGSGSDPVPHQVRAPYSQPATLAGGTA